MIRQRPASGAVPDRRSAREWLVVVGLGAGGLVLAAAAALGPWHLGGVEQFRGGTDRVVGVELPHGSGAQGVGAGLS
ncbi:MAG TPA: hypothetical protein VGP02_16780 [Mycobacteriales bacterium]|jgi:hypothetical protein|nr:hypothetical protein [Mycobacteriales bacterium]